MARLGDLDLGLRQEADRVGRVAARGVGVDDDLPVGAEGASGMVNVIGSAPALNSSRNFLSVTGSPRGSGSLIADPLRKTATDFAYDARQSSSVISSPGRGQPGDVGRARPCRPAPGTAPWKKRRRRKTGWRRRSLASFWVKASRSRSPAARDQSTQEISLSWQ